MEQLLTCIQSLNPPLKAATIFRTFDTWLAALPAQQQTDAVSLIQMLPFSDPQHLSWAQRLTGEKVPYIRGAFRMLNTFKYKRFVSPQALEQIWPHFKSSTRNLNKYLKWWASLENPEWKEQAKELIYRFDNTKLSDNAILQALRDAELANQFGFVAGKRAIEND